MANIELTTANSTTKSDLRASLGLSIGTDVQAYNQRADIGATAAFPFYVCVKNVTVLTTGTPSDIATITLPAWCTRYRIARDAMSFVVAETAAGTLASANFTIYNAASGGGSSISGSFTGPAAAAATVVITATLTNIAQTASTIYVRQTANSANAGTVSFYLLIVPLL